MATVVDLCKSKLQLAVLTAIATVVPCKIVYLCGAFRDGGRYFSKVTSYLLLITSHNVTHYSYILL